MEIDFSLSDNIQRIAIAVSGGGDSMALAHMLMQNGRKRKQPFEIHVLTVNHDLRDESRAEAEQVGRWVHEWPNVTHEILTWGGTKPDQGRMDAARQARYGLMADYCTAHDINLLTTAHHQDDQAETILMRLTCGSGLDGLAGMRAIKDMNDHLTLWRPLLNVSHEDLLSYCRANDIAWIEDPTNEDQHYTRSRLRAAREVLDAEGLSAKRLSVTAGRLMRASDALKELAEKLIIQASLEQSEGSICFDYAILRQAPEELRLRVLQNTIINMGDTASSYGPRFEKLEALEKTLFATKAKHTETLGGCIVCADPVRHTLTVTSEKVKNA